MIGHAALRKALSAGVFLSMKLGPKRGGSFAPMGAGKAEELARHEVAGVGGNEAKEPRFGFGVPERLQSIKMGRGDRHRTRIPDFRQETPGARAQLTHSRVRPTSGSYA